MAAPGAAGVHGPWRCYGLDDRLGSAGGHGPAYRPGLGAAGAAGGPALSGGLAMLTAMAATAWLAAMGLLTGLGLADRHGCAASVFSKRLPLICFRKRKRKPETVLSKRLPLIYFRNGIQKPFSEHGNGNGNPAQIFLCPRNGEVMCSKHFFAALPRFF